LDFINKYDTFIFDLDGTVYVENKLIPKADVTINKLQKLGKKICFVSNKTTGTPDDYFAFLSGEGVAVKKEQIITAAIVVKRFLRKTGFSGKFFAVGEKSFIEYLQDAGFDYSENPKDIDLVLVTLDRTLNYEKLEIAKTSINKGAEYYAVNIDATCPVEEGEILDAGSIISALEKATRKLPSENFGKPSHHMFELIKERIKIDKDSAIIIGDRLETDIKMGNDFGIDTALVQTGVPKIANGNFFIKPTYTINSIIDLVTN